MVHLLDGGLASTLQTDGCPVEGDPLWSARALHTSPDALLSVHSRFIEAGADIITSASYQANISNLTEHLDADIDFARNLISLSVRLARQCIDMTKRKGIQVAGSVGPYGACMSDGSEYTGSYLTDMTSCQLKEWHRCRLEVLIAAGADLIAVETVPGVKEALAVMELLREHPSVNFWVSFSCKDSCSISDGTLFREAVKTVANMSSSAGQMAAVGINCVHPDLVVPLLQSVDPRRVTKPFIVYPNNGDRWDGERWLKSEERLCLQNRVPEYLTAGADIIGGCCRVGPDDIALMRTALDQTAPRS